MLGRCVRLAVCILFSIPNNTQHPNASRPLAPEERAVVWRFRWSLTGEPRALTKVGRPPASLLEYAVSS